MVCQLASGRDEQQPLSLWISHLGLEDVFVWENNLGSGQVGLLIRARGVEFSGGWMEGEAGVGDPRVLFSLRMGARVACSLLFCLGGNLARMPVVDSEEAQDVFKAVHTMCCTLRKALVRRDLLNRGYRDETLQKRVLELMRRSDSKCWGEVWQFSRSCCLVPDAPQLALHVRTGDAAATPRDQSSPESLFEARRARQPAQAEAVPSPMELLTASALFMMPEMASTPITYHVPTIITTTAPTSKPKTAYQTFHKHQVAQLKLADPSIKHQTAFKKAGQMWSDMTEEERRLWVEKAEVKPRIPGQPSKKRQKQSSTPGTPVFQTDPDFMY